MLKFLWSLFVFFAVTIAITVVGVMCELNSILSVAIGLIVGIFAGAKA